MKKILGSFLLGVVLTLSLEIYADNILNVVSNQYPIEFYGLTEEHNSSLKDIKAYNINGATYINMRDISKIFATPVYFENNTIKIGSTDYITLSTFLLQDFSDIPNIDNVFTDTNEQPLTNININGSLISMEYVSDYSYSDTVEKFDSIMKKDGYRELTDIDKKNYFYENYGFNENGNAYIKINENNINRIVQIYSVMIKGDEGIIVEFNEF